MHAGHGSCIPHGASNRPGFIVRGSQTSSEVAGELPLARAFVLLRYVLIAAAIYLIVAEGEFAVPSPGILGLFLLAFVSNLAAGLVPATVASAQWFKTAIILGDTMWITLALAWSGHFESDFVHIYFFVLLLAAIGENLSLIAIGAVFVCVGYAYLMSANGEHWSLWRSPSIIRLPFLFTAAVFYGYLVDRMRAERRHSLLTDAAAAAKLELLATVGHEIRTPLSAVLGCANLLAEPDTGENQRKEHVATIRRNGEHLMRVIDDMLDFSKIETGELDIETTGVDPSRVVAEVESTMRVRATEKGIGLGVEIQGTLPARIQTDATRLRQILIQLVGNAIKFTDAGAVRLVLRMARPEEAARPSLRFEVTDTGVGISAEGQATLFRPFNEADASTARRFGGTGLGRAISKRLARLLGGDIGLSSASGKGSTFVLTVPVAGVPASDPPAPAAASVEREPAAGASGPLGGRILIAEDNPDNQKLFAHYLRKAGARVEVAENGLIACEMATRAVAAGMPFDVILMDMQMPELDGYQATARLRRGAYRRPILALTAFAMSGDREKCLAAGCDDFLSKPIKPERLIAAVRRHIDGQPPVEAGTAPGTRPQLPPAPAAEPLVSELADDAELRELITRYVAALPERAAALERSLAGGDLQALGKQAHELRGTAGTYGFPSLTHEAGMLEVTVRHGRPSTEIHEHVARLIDLCRRARATRREASPRR